ncbi:MAG: LamG domain-containing protein [Armatimonadota bacterium]
MNWIRLIVIISTLLAPVICHSSGSDGQTVTTEATPTIVFDHVPLYGSKENLTGHVTNVIPSEYRVSVFIYTSGWWTKPYFDESIRLVPINPDGAWTCSITTGQGDEMATRIAAYLLPASYMPPISQGFQEIPAEVSQHAVANVQVTRTNPELPREIDFSGLKWTVKKSEFLVGPPSAGNYFSASADDVWVDALGRLHLRISNHDGRWYCSEVIGKDSFGYGTYRFVIDNDPAAIDYNAVFGLFTWDDTAPSPYREIDIEFSRWGNPTDPNAQYVLMPYDQPNHRHRYNLASLAGTSTHSLTWSQDALAFSSYTGGTQLQS